MRTPTDSIRWYSESLTRYVASLLYLVTCYGYERKDRQVWPPSDDPNRYIVWCADSLLWTIEEYQAGHYTHALRGVLQAAGYLGKIGGCSTLNDAYGHLRNALEAATDYTIAHTQHCRCGVLLAVCTWDGHERRLAEMHTRENA